MPIKWTVDAERQLLLLILKIQGRPFAADAKAIANLWQESEKPSARAIVERIHKLRKIVDTGENEASPPTPIKTPQKRKAASSSSSSGRSGSSSKRARAGGSGCGGGGVRDKLGDEDTDDSEPDLSGPSTPSTARSTRPRKNGGKSSVSVAGDGVIGGGSGGGGRNTIYVDSDVETMHESDISEYQPVKEEALNDDVKFRQPSVVLA